MVEQMLSGRRVLVVEDEMLVLMAIEDMLTDLGCTSVTAAANVDQALAAIDTQSFDLATLDVNLNGHRSYVVAEALDARGVPFAFSTGYGEHGLANDHRHRPVLNKPFNYPQLIKVLTGLLAPAGSPPIAT